MTYACALPLQWLHCALALTVSEEKILYYMKVALDALNASHRPFVDVTTKLYNLNTKQLASPQFSVTLTIFGKLFSSNVA